MVVITAVQLRGHVFGQPCYVIEKVACLSFDEYRACSKLNSQHVEEPEKAEQRPVKLTQSSSFITKIKSTFSKKREEEILEAIVHDPVLEENEIVADHVEIPTTLPLSSSISSATVSSLDEEMSDTNDEEDVLLEARLIRQIVDLFSKSMFVFSNSFGKNSFYCTRIPFNMCATDLTNSFQSTHKNKANSDTPLWKKVDKRFWWNEHISQDFIDQNVRPFYIISYI